MNEKPDAILLVGPTASGKTAFALDLAKKLPIEIISVDSALVYKGMDIGTAKPTAEELASVPHHLIDIITPLESYSAAQFAEDCTRLVREIRGRGRLPMIVGGTMLYAKAIRDGLSEVPTTTPEVRDRVAKELEEKGLASLYERLKTVDPKTAERLKPGDTQRISRAIEVYEMSRRPISSFYADQKPPVLKLRSFALLPPDRAELHRRIALRFDQMLEAGFIDEVKRLREIPGLTTNYASMRCVGYRQAWEYLDGKKTFDEFRESGIAATRQLAKRQMTWMRSMKDTELLDPTDPKSFEVWECAAHAAL